MLTIPSSVPEKGKMKYKYPGQLRTLFAELRKWFHQIQAPEFSSTEISTYQLH